MEVGMGCTKDFDSGLGRSQLQNKKAKCGRN